MMPTAEASVRMKLPASTADQTPEQPVQVGVVVLVNPLPLIGTLVAATLNVLDGKVMPRFAATLCVSKFAVSVALLSVPTLPAASVGLVPPASV